MNVEILCTGDEILTGKTTNTNYSYIAQRLTENGITVVHGTSVGDNSSALKAAFLQAAGRADAVIVNGGLGPTVDDLSQQTAADAAGVELVLHSKWLEKLKHHYKSRGRDMPENNSKQAMLPAGSQLLDNPIGTACGFAVTIDEAQFFFTPGVPREMKRMINEQVMPRLRKMHGNNTVTSLKRFHTFGIGESRADQLLLDVIPAKNKNAIKLGFQTHYPQLETKLAVQAADESQINDLLDPVVAELRKRLGNAILCEDDQTIESVILQNLRASQSTLSCMEMATAGGIAQRLMTAQMISQMTSLSDNTLLRCEVSPGLKQLTDSLNLVTDAPPLTTGLATILAEAHTKSCGSTHALVVLTEERKTETSSDLIVSIGIFGPKGASQRQAILPGKTDWTRLGATELALDCLRRYLAGLPVNEKIDFEKTPPAG